MSNELGNGLGKQKFEGGATRSMSKYRFDLIPPEGHRAVAKRFADGADVHGEGNWKSGGVEFIKSVFNHLEDHLTKLKGGIEMEDDHIGAILWAGYALAWFKDNKGDQCHQALVDMKLGKNRTAATASVQGGSRLNEFPHEVR